MKYNELEENKDEYKNREEDYDKIIKAIETSELAKKEEKEREKYTADDAHKILNELNYIRYNKASRTQYLSRKQRLIAMMIIDVLYEQYKYSIGKHRVKKFVGKIKLTYKVIDKYNDYLHEIDDKHNMEYLLLHFPHLLTNKKTNPTLMYIKEYKFFPRSTILNTNVYAMKPVFFDTMYLSAGQRKHMHLIGLNKMGVKLAKLWVDKRCENVGKFKL